MQQFSALPLYALIFFLAILVFLELGLRLGRRHLRRDPGGMKSGLGAVEAAVFGLMGLLIAFTFSGAAQQWHGSRAEHGTLQETLSEPRSGPEPAR